MKRRVIGYNEHLDANARVEAEHAIWLAIIDFTQEKAREQHIGPDDAPYFLCAADATDLARQVLVPVLGIFRPDLCVFEHVEHKA